MLMIDRLRYRRPGVALNPFILPFLFYTFVSGFSFVFFPHTAAVQASVLHQLTLAHAPDVAISIWGVIAMAVSIMAVVGLLVRHRWMGEVTTWAGFGLWSFSVIIFAVYGFWLQVFTAGFINLFFWIWYWFMVRQYYNNHEPAP